jgi:hypothetical protein
MQGRFALRFLVPALFAFLCSFAMPGESAIAVCVPKYYGSLTYPPPWPLFYLFFYPALQVPSSPLAL